MRVSSNEIRALKELLENFKTTKEPSSTIIPISTNGVQLLASTLDFRASPKAHIIQNEIKPTLGGNTPSRYDVLQTLVIWHSHETKFNKSGINLVLYQIV